MEADGRRQGRGQQDAQGGHHRIAVARRVIGLHGQIIRGVQRQTSKGEASCAGPRGAVDRHGGHRTVIGGRDEQPEATQIGGRGVAGPTHGDRGIVRGDQAQHRDGGRGGFDQKARGIGGRQQVAKAILSGGNPQLLGAIHAGEEGDGRGDVSIVGQRARRPRSVGRHHRLQRRRAVREPDERRNIGRHGAVELQGEDEIGGGGHRVAEIGQDVGQLGENRQGGVHRHVLQVGRIQGGKGLRQGGIGAGDRVAQRELAEEVVVRRIGHQCRRTEERHLAVGVKARPGHGSDARGGGGGGDGVEEVRRVVIGREGMVGVNDRAQRRIGAHDVGPFRPVGEAVAEDRIRGQEAGVPVEVGAGPGHVARAGGVVAGRDGEQGQDEVGNQLPVAGDGEGVIGGAGLNLGVLRPVGEHIREEVGVGEGADRDGGTGGERTPAARAAGARRIDRGGDGINRAGVRLEHEVDHLGGVGGRHAQAVVIHKRIQVIAAVPHKIHHILEIAGPSGDRDDRRIVGPRPPVGVDLRSRQTADNVRRAVPECEPNVGIVAGRAGAQALFPKGDHGHGATVVHHGGRQPLAPQQGHDLRQAAGRARAPSEIISAQVRVNTRIKDTIVRPQGGNAADRPIGQGARLRPGVQEQVGGAENGRRNQDGLVGRRIEALTGGVLDADQPVPPADAEGIITRGIRRGADVEPGHIGGVRKDGELGQALALGVLHRPRQLTGGGTVGHDLQNQGAGGVGNLPIQAGDQSAQRQALERPRRRTVVDQGETVPRLGGVTIEQVDAQSAIEIGSARNIQRPAVAVAGESKIQGRARLNVARGQVEIKGATLGVEQAGVVEGHRNGREAQPGGLPHRPGV